jgi:hypothetical protein
MKTFFCIYGLFQNLARLPLRIHNVPMKSFFSVFIGEESALLYGISVGEEADLIMFS